ncbi:uncharacterized protein [Watersipora subatra]|uniref:uncharacterized protein n=1 Tax=Watersipora subatra TaxID=2589382 RepID=UPI00355B220E
MNWGDHYALPSGGYAGLSSMEMQQANVDQYNAQQVALDQYNLAARAANFAQYNQQQALTQFQQDLSTAQPATGFVQQTANHSFSHAQQSGYSASWPIEDGSVAGARQSNSSMGLHETVGASEGATQANNYPHRGQLKRSVELEKIMPKDEAAQEVKHPEGFGWPIDREERYAKRRKAQKAESQACSTCPICKQMIELDNWVRHATTHAKPSDDVVRPAQKDADYWFIDDLLKNATKDSTLIGSYSCQFCEVVELNFEEMLNHIQEIKHMHAIYRWISQPSTIGNERYKSHLPDIPIRSRHLGFHFCELCHELVGWVKNEVAQHLTKKQHIHRVQKMRENLQWVIKGHKMRNEESLSADLADELHLPPPLMSRAARAMDISQSMSAPSKSMSNDTLLHDPPPPEQKEVHMSNYDQSSKLVHHVYTPASQRSVDQGRSDKYHGGIGLPSSTELSYPADFDYGEVEETESIHHERVQQLGAVKPKVDQRKVCVDVRQGVSNHGKYVARYGETRAHPVEQKAEQDSFALNEAKQMYRPSSGPQIPKGLNRGKLQEIVHSIRSTSAGEAQKHTDVSRSKAAVLPLFKGNSVSTSDTFTSRNISSSNPSMAKESESTRSQEGIAYSNYANKCHSSHTPDQPTQMLAFGEGRSINRRGCSPIESTNISNSNGDPVSEQHRSLREKQNHSTEQEGSLNLQRSSLDRLGHSLVQRNLTSETLASPSGVPGFIDERQTHSSEVRRESLERYKLSTQVRECSAEQQSVHEKAHSVEPYVPQERRYQTSSRQQSQERDMLMKQRTHEVSSEKRGLLDEYRITERRRVSNRERSPGVRKMADKRQSFDRRRTPDKHQVSDVDIIPKRSPDRRRTPDRRRSPGQRRSPGRRRSPIRHRSPGQRRSPIRHRSPGQRRSPIRHRSPGQRRPSIRQRSPVRQSRLSSFHGHSSENRSHYAKPQSSAQTFKAQKQGVPDKTADASDFVKKPKRRLSPVVLDANARAALTKRIETTWQIYYHKYYSCVLTNPEIVLEMQKEYLRSYKGFFKNDPHFELYYTKVAKPEDLREALTLRIDRGSPGPEPEFAQEQVHMNPPSSAPRGKWMGQPPRPAFSNPQTPQMMRFNSPNKPFGVPKSTARRPVIDVVDITDNITKNTVDKSPAFKSASQTKKISDCSNSKFPLSLNKQAKKPYIKLQQPPPTNTQSNPGLHKKLSRPYQSSSDTTAPKVDVRAELYGKSKDKHNIAKSVFQGSAEVSCDSGSNLFSGVKPRGIFPESSPTSSDVNNKIQQPLREDRFKEREDNVKEREGRFKDRREALTDHSAGHSRMLKSIERNDRFEEARSQPKGNSQNDPVITSTTQELERKRIQLEKDGSRSRSVLGRLGPQRKFNASSGAGSHSSSQDVSSRRVSRSSRDKKFSSQTKETKLSERSSAQLLPTKSSEATLTEMFSDPFLGFVHKTLTGILLVGQYQESMAGSREPELLQDKINTEQEHMQARMVTPDGHLLIQLARCCIENPDDIEKSFPDINPDIGIILRNLDKNVVTIIADTPIVVNQSPKHPY